MQGVKISDMLEDSLIHIPNILTMLYNRGIIKETDYQSITTQFNNQKQSGLVTIQINNTNPKITFNGNIQAHHKIIQNYCNITQSLNYSVSKILIMYIFPFINKTINTQFKRIVDSNEFDTVIVFCDDQCIKTLKKIIYKEDLLRKQSNKPNNKCTRYDLIHFDTVLLNLLKNYHSSNYQMIDEQSLSDICNNKHINPLYLHKIFPNDPVALYYGFVPFTVIQENFLSEITGGISSVYLLVTPTHPEQDVYQSFTYFIQ